MTTTKVIAMTATEIIAMTAVILNQQLAFNQQIRIYFRTFVALLCKF
jgi:hypothetical protein